MKPQDRRGAERQQITVPVRMDDAAGETHDVSATGVCMYMDTVPSIGSRITFEMDLPPGPFRGPTRMRFEAEVVRVEERDGRQAVGAKFIDWQLADA